jgi:hypothetical protein
VTRCGAETGQNRQDRFRRSVPPTAWNVPSARSTRASVSGWDAGVEEARAAAPTGTLVIGMQTAVGRGLQHEALRKFRAGMPGWEVSLRLVGLDDPSGGTRGSGMAPSTRSPYSWACVNAAWTSLAVGTTMSK